MTFSVLLDDPALACANAVKAFFIKYVTERQHGTSWRIWLNAVMRRANALRGRTGAISVRRAASSFLCALHQAVIFGVGNLWRIHHT